MRLDPFPRQHAAMRLQWILGVLLTGVACAASAAGDTMLIDDFSRKDFVSTPGTQWRAISDRVMGGVSQAAITREAVEGCSCFRLRGNVRLDNNGGFIQAALDLAPYRLESGLETKNLTRVGLVAIERDFSEDLMIARVSFYR